MKQRPAPVMTPKRYRRLLTTAAREFAAAGFEHASLNAIIQACRMSKSSFYHYFPSKQALFDTVVEEAAAELAKALDAPDPSDWTGPDFWGRVAAFVAHAEAVAAQQTWYADFGKLFYLPDVPAEQSPTLRRILAVVSDWLARALAAGRAGGTVGDDLPATLQASLVFAVLQAMDRWALAHMHEFDAATRKRLATQQIAALRALLEPKAG